MLSVLLTLAHIVCTYAFTHVSMAHRHTDTHTDTHIHACTHAHTHTYTHIHTYITHKHIHTRCIYLLMTYISIFLFCLQNSFQQSLPLNASRFLIKLASLNYLPYTINHINNVNIKQKMLYIHTKLTTKILYFVLGLQRIPIFSIRIFRYLNERIPNYLLMLKVLKYN